MGRYLTLPAGASTPPPCGTSAASGGPKHFDAGRPAQHPADRQFLRRARLQGVPVDRPLLLAGDVEHDPAAVDERCQGQADPWMGSRRRADGEAETLTAYPSARSARIRQSPFSRTSSRVLCTLSR